MFETTPQIDKQNPLPRHAQVQRILREMVRCGELRPGDKIPAELHIADALGVSKMTVNKALLALTASGLFVREVGRGTFVAPEALSAATSETLSGGFALSSGSASARGAAPAPSGKPRLVLSFVEGARNVLDSDYYSNLYRGISDALHEDGPDRELSVDLVLSPLAARDYLAEEDRDPADGRILIAPRSESVSSIEALWQQGRPLIVLGASWPMMGVPSVDSDNIGGAMEAIRHLVEMGHERIALVSAEEETANMMDRIVGYRRALSGAHLPQSLSYEVHCDAAWHIGDSAKEQLAALLTQSSPVTAIFAAGHYLALEAMNTVRDTGLRVPEDVSVVGFDDPLSAQLVYPALTTIRQPLYEMGRRAGERMLRLLRGEETRAAIREVLPAQLMVRRSTASAPVLASMGAKNLV
ncbi:MAG: GntR family transcriptional regulator [Cytophagales bacterium]|nr:GntR family transcriptional regulator [Armatimonadota bacterium]